MIRFIASFAGLGIINLVLVNTIYRPVSQLSGSGEAFLHPVFGFAVYISLMVWLFDWTARKIGNAWHAAAGLGGAQFLLVNVDMTLRGDRALETAVASTIVLIVSWSMLALIWQWAQGRENRS